MAARSRVRLRVVGVLCLLAGFLLAWPAGALAQDKVEFRAETDQTSVPVGGQLTLTLILSGGRVAAEPKLPALAGFRVYSSSRSQSMSLINGQLSSSISYIYLLVAEAEGTQTIGPAEISVGGQVYRTQPLTVQVTAGRQPSAPAAPNTAGEPPRGIQNEELFVDMIVDKAEAYVGEQITLSFRFFQRVNLLDQPRYTPPALNGFWSEQMSPQAQGRQTINGRSYVVTELKTALFATTAGPQTVGAAALEIRDFFNGNRILTANPLSVMAKSLPAAGQPPDFAGAVGRYQVSAWLEPAEGRAHEPVTLFFKISGEGNIQNAPEPAWNLPAGMRAYDAKSNSQSKYTSYVVQGDKTFEKLIVPEKEGEWVIPPQALAYFDPADGAYHRAESQPLTLRVAAGAAEPAALPAPGTPAVAARDIRHIKPAPARVAGAVTPIYQRPIFWLLWFLPALAVLAGVIFRVQRRRLTQDPRYARLRRSHQMARRRLQRARAHIGAGEARAGCSAIAEALAQYVADKTNRPAAGLTEAAICDILAGQGAAEMLTRQFSACWQRCDLGRFAPADLDGGALRALLTDAEELIVQLEELAWRA